MNDFSTSTMLEDWIDEKVICGKETQVVVLHSYGGTAQVPHFQVLAPCTTNENGITEGGS